MPRAPRTFDNPILPGFFPDPSICRVEEDYYLVASSFEYFPGIPIFHSRDLVHWQPIGHVLERESQLPLASVKSSGGIFAPTIRHHRGRFYVVCTNVGGGGNFIVTATRPEGPWSEPKYIDKDGFDPSLFFDNDGTAYYTRDGTGPDMDHPLIYAARIDPDKGKLLEKPKPIFAGTGGVWTEASHLYRVGSFYYLVIAEGGTSYDHTVVVARSRRPKGPFETCPRNPILGHAGRPRHPFQAVGHADFIETQLGESYAVLLGIRPKGGRYHHLGRETFLVPVIWDEDGWPRMGKNGVVEGTFPFPNLPVFHAAAARSRVEFAGKRLPWEFAFVRNPDHKSYSLTSRPGYLRLRGLPATMSDLGPVAFVGRRQQHFECTVRTLLEFSPKGMADEAGLVIRSSEAFHYDFVVRRSSLENEAEREAQLWSVVAGRRKLVGKQPLPPGTIELTIRATSSDYEFAAGVGRKRKVLGSLPTRSLSTEYALRSGSLGFTGVVFGMYASGQGQRAQSEADFAWLEYSPRAD
jgi:alpha-N-arabinofuranosidase